MMDRKNALALIVAYYLSKYDQAAYARLGLGGVDATHKNLSEILDVKYLTLKNMRDEFDPLHDNPRRGWHRRKLRPTRERVVEMFGGMDEMGLYFVVRDILFVASFRDSDEVGAIAREIADCEEGASCGSISPAARLISGRMAEDYFITYHTMTQEPVAGELHDTRLHACGYDFEIRNSTLITFIEVKGTAEHSGGIVFTDKEWRVATNAADAFVLAVVRNLLVNPYIHFIRNPASVLQPKQRLYTSVERTWQVSGSQLP